MAYAGEIAQHVRAHHAVAQIVLGADDHGRQLALCRVHGLTGVEPQRLGIGHHAGAEHFFKILHDLGRDLFDLRGKAQRHGGLALPDGGL